MKSVGIVGAGHYLPPTIFKNDDFVKLGLDTSDEWISERTGIRERRIIDKDKGSSDLAVEAAKMAIENAGLTTDDIDLVIVATSTPDHILFPSTAALVQDKLGLRTVGAFDVSAACTGFNYAFTTGLQFVQTGFAKNVLVIGVDCLSKFVDWQDRSICVLFGDGAGAVVLSEVEDNYGVLASKLHSEGKYGPILRVPDGGSKTVISKEVLEKRSHFIQMDGKAVFKVAVNRVVPVLFEAIEEANLSPDDVSYLIPHQANLRIINYACDKMGLAREQVIINIEKYGNTSAASIPIALSEAASQGRFKDQDVIVLVGFGGGFTWGANIIRWGGIK